MACLKTKILKDLNHIYYAIITAKFVEYTYRAPAIAFPRKKHSPMLTPTSGPRARPMR